MLEFRHLSHLLVACEHENLTLAAQELQIAPSTLSASLKALETECGLELFKRLGGGLYPRSSARWLFRSALAVLLLERHTRRRLTRFADAEPRILTVAISPLFTIGRITKMVLQAIHATEAEDPLTLVNPVWINDEQTPFGADWLTRLDFRDAGQVSLDLAGPEIPSPPTEAELLQDPWVFAFRCPSLQPQDSSPPASLSERTLVVPGFSSAEVQEKSERYLGEHRPRRVKSLRYHPGSLPRLVNEHPDAAFLLPSCALAGRLGLLHVRSVPLDPPLASRLTAVAARPSEAADGFIGRLRGAVEAPHDVTIFSQELTSRRVRYFNLAHRIRSVSAAARAANVAQPALGEQLRKLELTLGGRLFERRSDGVSPSPLGALFAPVSLSLEEGLRSLSVGLAAASAPESGRLSLGVLPSVSQHGLLVNRIADAIFAVQNAYPGLKVTVHEAANSTLQDWVMRGVVGLAIVETGPPNVPRLSLGSSEGLAVIAHPGHHILPPGPVRFADLAKLPLALPTPLSGLRQLLEDAAQANHVRLRPAMQVDALPMLITLLQREPICTVLPPSAVRRELDARELCAHQIVNPGVERRMFVIHSGDRALTKAERELTAELRARLTDARPEANPPESAAA